MSKGTYIYFKDLPVKSEFVLNGVKCIKQSTRTILFTDYNRWFYANKGDLCVVGSYCKI